MSNVRLTDEREGWIKSSYLSTQVPAIVRLKELEKERGAAASVPSTQLADDLKQLKEHNAALQTELAAAKQVAAQAAATSKVPVVTPPQGRLEGETSSRSEESFSLHHHLSWSTALVFLSGSIGFLLGYQTLARRIRRKYGSVKIY